MARGKGSAPFEATHVVGDDSLDTYETPDASRPTAPLDPGLRVQVTENLGDWAHVVCDNGWSAWVDGRLLVPVAAPNPMWEEIEGALAAQKELLADFETNRIDEATYRARTFRAGLIIHEGDAWMIDLANQQIHRYDGFQLRTLDLADAAGS
jgi:hypothetical protein